MKRIVLLTALVMLLAELAPAQTTPGYLPLKGGILLAKQIENCRWVDSASNWGSGDFGAKVNAALADAGPRGAVCIASGSYTYSTDIVMSAPQTLICQGMNTCVLDYTGTGDAIKVGPDGLTVSTYSPDQYTVQGFLLTGGASMAKGIYVNEFVVKSQILFNEFRNFGNGSAWDIWFQGQNWESRVFGNYIWNVAQGCNGIYQNAADPANGTNGDYGQSQGSFSSNHIQGCTTAAYVNGQNVKVLDNTFTGSGGPAIIVGGYGNEARIQNDDMEEGQTGSSSPCIQFGDATGPRAGNFIDSIEISNNDCNAHNSSFSTTSHFVGPTTASAGIENMLLYNNNVGDLADGQPLVVQNNLASQNNNNAYDNKVNDCNCSTFTPLFTVTRLHTTGSNLSWGGSDGDVFVTYGAATINGNLTVNTKIGTQINNPVDAEGDLFFSCGLTAQQDCAFNFEDQNRAVTGRIVLASPAHGGRLSIIDGANGFLQGDLSGNAYLGKNGLATVDPTGKGTFGGGIIAGTGTPITNSSNVPQTTATAPTGTCTPNGYIVVTVNGATLHLATCP